MTEAYIGARSQHETEADLVCEALVREIARGGRWTAVREAWQAILTVRRMAQDLSAEDEVFRRSQMSEKGDSHE